MIVRGAFNHLLRPGLRSDFRDDYMSFESEYDGILRTGTLDRAELEATTISGLPRQVVLPEGESYTILDPELADKIVYTDTQFGMGFSISQEMMEDDLYDRANQSAKWLARSTRLIQEYQTADWLDDAFTGTTFTGFAAEALISSTHSLLGSAQTWSNNVSGDPQLGVLGLQAAFELGELTVDHLNDPIPVRIDKLFVNVSEEWVAINLTQNESEPFTSDRNLNATRRKRQLSYQVSHYKDQSGADWFARDTQVHDAHFLFKVSPQFPDWFEDKVRSAFFASRQRFLVYHYDPRGWIGSNAS
ncbi:MAG: hypothetical protein V3T23_03125 [Nitrososphaerales archaeon]